MGKAYSLLMRPIRTFNIENRARKIISQKKPIPAPQYPSTQKQKELSDKINPDFLESYYKKNVQLDQRLKDVFVTSTDAQVAIPMTKSKPLPQKGFTSDDHIFELFEPTIIPEGKCSLKQTLIFISQHKQDSTKYTSENIAVEYKLDKRVVGDILKHFKLFTVVEGKSESLLKQTVQESLGQKYQEGKKLEIEKTKT